MYNILERIWWRGGGENKKWQGSDTSSALFWFWFLWEETSRRCFPTFWYGKLAVVNIYCCTSDHSKSDCLKEISCSFFKKGFLTSFPPTQWSSDPCSDSLVINKVGETATHDHVSATTILVWLFPPPAE